MFSSLFLAVAVSVAEVVSIPFDLGNIPPIGFFSHSWRYPGTGTVERVCFTLRAPFRTVVSVRMVDSTGQTFQSRVAQGSEAWFPNENAVDGQWELHFGGAKDGVFHHPLKDFQVLVHGGKSKTETGSVFVKDVQFHEKPTCPPTLKVIADVYREVPPKTMSVEVNADRGHFPGGEFAAKWQDWDGNVLATHRVACPAVASGGVWRTEMPYAPRPSGKNAIFCDAELRYGTETLKRECPAWTAPVDAEPSAVPKPDSPWGTGIYLHRWGFSERSFRMMERLVETASRAGIRCLREQMLWYQIAENGTHDFSDYDRIMRICETNGMSLCMLFCTIWRREDTKAPDYPERYCAALRQAVRHYRGKVAAWEICNEPNLPWPMAPEWMDNYRRLLPMATSVVHEEDPSARTVGCSASGLGLGFVKSLANETFDDVSVHPYRRFVDEREFLADLDELYAASRGRDVWMTEIGWDSFPGFRRNADVGHLVSLHEYASLIARAYMTAASGKGVRAVFGYDFVDDGMLAAGFEYHMGIVYGDASPKPAYRAVAKVCRTFPDGKPSMTVGDDGLTVFRMGGKCAVWVHGFEPSAIEAEGAAMATNLMDEKALPEMRDGSMVYFTDSRHPLFFDREMTFRRLK